MQHSCNGDEIRVYEKTAISDKNRFQSLNMAEKLIESLKLPKILVDPEMQQDILSDTSKVK